jgi:hypothetical protein
MRVFLESSLPRGHAALARAADRDAPVDRTVLMPLVFGY